MSKVNWDSLNVEEYLNYINSIIEKRGQWSDPGDELWENHHIVPRCAGGLPKTTSHNKVHDNLIWLSFEEHYTAHKILALNNINNYQIVQAWQRMSNMNNGRVIETGEEYDILRKNALKLNKEYHTGQPSPNKGKKLSDEQKLKISIATKLAMQRDDVREKLSNKIITKPAWNKGLTKETSDIVKKYTENMRKTLTGRKLTKEHRENISKGQTCRVVSKETIEKISKSQSGLNSKRNRKVICVDTGVIYYSGKFASQETGVNHSNIIQSCRTGKKAGGYVWRYCDD